MADFFLVVAFSCVACAILTAWMTIRGLLA